MSILLICDDFFFANKITGTAGALGMKCIEVGSHSQAVEKIATSAFALCLVDLSAAGLDIAAVTDAFPPESRPTVMAFASHVDAQAMQQARDAGCDEVLPRSRFSAELPQILQRFATPANE